MAKAIWKGSINFGLVNIGIELFTATQEHVLGFKILHAKCSNPIINKRWCPHCEQEVTWDETVKGLKLKDGSYFIITQENLNKLKPEKTDLIKINEFVDKNVIPTVFFDHHYYVLPKGKSDNSFFLFAKALEQFGKVAIGQFVMRDKEYICMIEPYQNAMSLTTLNYLYEVKQMPEINVLKSAAISKQELDLAGLLMKRLYSKKLDMSKYKDEFAQNLLKNVVSSKKGKKIVTKKTKEIKKVEPTLLNALKASLQQIEAPKSKV